MSNLALDRNALIDASMEKIHEYLSEKKYFLARDELLKYNEADIAEMLEDISDDLGLRNTVILSRISNSRRVTAAMA